MKKIVALFAFSLLTFTGCTQNTPQENPTVPIDSAQTTQSLSGTWRWERTQMNDDTVITPQKAEAFTISFFTDEATGETNKVSGTTDCNGFFGSYFLQDNQITFNPLGSTMMYCEGSQESEFLGQIQSVNQFLMETPDQLVLLLPYDSGSMIFVPQAEAPQTNEAPQANDEVTTSSQDYIGLSVADAENLARTNSVPFRIVEQDGEALAATMDYVPGRINASVAGGIVTTYTVEGQ